MVSVRSHARHRGAYVAAGIAIAALLPRVAATDPLRHQGGGNTANRPGNQSPAADAKPIRAAPLETDAERIASALEGANRYAQAPQQQQAAADNLAITVTL